MLGHMRSVASLSLHGSVATSHISRLASADLSSTASTYASFAEILTGFSFAALAIYLAYEPARGVHSEVALNSLSSRGIKKYSTKDSNGRQKHPFQVAKERPIRRTQVAATIFYGMASLAISSFLYASLTAQAADPEKAVTLVLIYGVVFGLSVLSFFYSLTLMTYENTSTRAAAKSAYLVVVIVGPAIILRFLSDAAQSASIFRCTTHACRGQRFSQILIIGMVILFALLALSVAVSNFRIFETRTWLYGICNTLCARPVAPAFSIFIFASTVTIAGTGIADWVNPKFAPAGWILGLSLTVGAILLALFALACGCVIGPRVNAEPTAVVTGPGFISLPVRNLSFSRNFYIQQLGLRQAVSSPPGAVLFDTAPIPFAIKESQDHETPPSSEVWLATDDVEGIYQRLAQSETEITQPPSRGRLGRQFTFADPDGHSITIHQPD